MKLWIDDIRNAPDDTWVVARTINSAIKAIRTFNIEEISFDHDISHQVTMEALSRPYPCGECFCAVAYYVSVALWPQKPKVTIHTSNPAGAKEIEAILKEGQMPAIIIMMGSVNRLELEVK